MAPPTARRSAGSKRARFNIFTGYVVATLGALVGALLLAVSLWQPDLFGGSTSAARDLTAPAGQAGAAARTGGMGFIESVQGYLRAGRQNARLKDEVELARIRLAEAEALRNENRRLKALLGMRAGTVEPVAYARLIGASGTSARRFAYLGAGRSDGVRPGMPVRSPRGVVGRVLRTGRSSARVLLLTDSESVVPVRRSTDETIAFAEGRGDGTVRIRLISLGINPLRPGDVFVTSGTGGIYRPGLAVAILQSRTEDGGIARILADPIATDYVAVDPVYEPAIAPAVEPVTEQGPDSEPETPEDSDTGSPDGQLPAPQT